MTDDPPRKSVSQSLFENSSISFVLVVVLVLVLDFIPDFEDDDEDEDENDSWHPSFQTGSQCLITFPLSSTPRFSGVLMRSGACSFFQWMAN